MEKSYYVEYLVLRCPSVVHVPSDQLHVHCFFTELGKKYKKVKKNTKTCRSIVKHVPALSLSYINMYMYLVSIVDPGDL